MHTAPVKQHVGDAAHQAFSDFASHGIVAMYHNSQEFGDTIRNHLAANSVANDGAGKLQVGEPLVQNLATVTDRRPVNMGLAANFNPSAKA